MGFGLLVIGYITVFGVLPYSFLYYSGGIYIAVGGGILMLLGFCRLEEYNIYFRAMKYISVAYILILLGFTPFLVPRHSEEFMAVFLIVSKIIRICLLFVFHYFMLSGILSLAKEIGNTKVEKKAKINIYASYIFFALFILEFMDNPVIGIALFMLTFVYYCITLSTLYGCYMRITYEGHDEEVEAKYAAEMARIEEIKNRKKTKK